MGKVRIETVKKTARELMSRYPERFSADYEQNKRVLVELVDVKAKRLRNRIAGYVTRLKRIQDRMRSGGEEAEADE